MTHEHDDALRPALSDELAAVIRSAKDAARAEGRQVLDATTVLRAAARLEPEAFRVSARRAGISRQVVAAFAAAADEEPVEDAPADDAAMDVDRSVARVLAALHRDGDATVGRALAELLADGSVRARLEGHRTPAFTTHAWLEAERSALTLRAPIACGAPKPASARELFESEARLEAGWHATPRHAPARRLHEDWGVEPGSDPARALAALFVRELLEAGQPPLTVLGLLRLGGNPTSHLRGGRERLGALDRLEELGLVRRVPAIPDQRTLRDHVLPTDRAVDDLLAACEQDPIAPEEVEAARAWLAAR